MNAPPWIVWLGEDGGAERSLVGGKAASLSRLATGHLVPPGFCLTTEAFQAAGVDGSWAAEGSTKALSAALFGALAEAYLALGTYYGVAEPPVAVRSSAVDEDGSGASFAGQHETYLNVRGVGNVAAAVTKCWRSLYLPRALSYRRERGLSSEGARLAVLVQQLVPAEVSGVLFSANPVTRSRNEAVLTASWGLGESVVGGTVTPDTYVVQKAPLAMRARHVGTKRRMTVMTPGGTEEVAVPPGLQTLPVLDDAIVLDAVRLGSRLEAEMGCPVDIELAWHAAALYLLQCRPITTALSA